MAKLNNRRSAKLNEIFPHIKGQDGSHYCRFCKKKLTGRKTSWCSKNCSDQAFIICWPSFARYHVEKRDHGVCAICGLDTIRLRNLYLRAKQPLKLSYKKVFNLNNHLPELKKFDEREQHWINHRKKRIENILLSKGFTKKDLSKLSLWEADHIVPVVKGGGLCGLSNYRTLCIPCHRKETKILRKELRDVQKGSCSKGNYYRHYMRLLRS